MRTLVAALGLAVLGAVALDGGRHRPPISAPWRVVSEPRAEVHDAVAAVPPATAAEPWVVATRAGLVTRRWPGREEIAWDLRTAVDAGGPGTGLVDLARVPMGAIGEAWCASYVAEGPTRLVLAALAPDGTPTTILEVPFELPVHVGGCLAAGPPGEVFLAVGDGGAPYDPFGNAQDRRRLPGSILRLDLRIVGAHGGYGVPLDNPFVGRQGLRDEIWAYGFANAGALGYDGATARLWCIDDGAPGVVEVAGVRGGENHGWNIMAGRRCVEPLPGCERSGLTSPAGTLAARPGDSFGGVVRDGRYFFGDRGAGAMMSLPTTGDAVVRREGALPPGARALVPGPDGVPHVVTADGKVHRYQ